MNFLRNKNEKIVTVFLMSFTKFRNILNSMSLSARCEETSPDSKHVSFIYGGGTGCMRIYYASVDKIKMSSSCEL